MRFLFVFLFLSALRVFDVAAFTVCNAPTPFMTIINVTIAPTPVDPGKVMHVSMNGVSHDVVTDGEITAVAEVYDVKMGHKTFELCELTTCPLLKDDAFDMVMDYMVPTDIPHVHATLEITVRDMFDNILACVRMNVNVGIEV